MFGKKPAKPAAKPGKAAPAKPGNPFGKTGSAKPGGAAKNFSKGKGKR